MYHYLYKILIKVQLIMVKLFDYTFELSYKEDERTRAFVRYNKILAISEFEQCSFILYRSEVIYESLI